jgi:hypothetical protein
VKPSALEVQQLTSNPKTLKPDLPVRGAEQKFQAHSYDTWLVECHESRQVLPIMASY